MLRSIILALLALGIGVFASSLLRTEGRAAGPVGTDEAKAGSQRCSASTRSGSRCSRPALPGADRCWQHQD